MNKQQLANKDMGICQQDALQDRSQRIQRLYSWLDFL